MPHDPHRPRALLHPLTDAFHRERPRLVAKARRAVGPSLAEDLAQRASLAAWKAQSRYDPARSPPGAWLVGVLRRTIANHLKAQADDIVDLAPDAAFTERPANDAPPDARLHAIDVLSLLDLLPPEERAVFTARVFDELPWAEIARATAVAVHVVEYRFRKAAERLRAAAIRRGLGPIA